MWWFSGILYFLSRISMALYDDLVGLDGVFYGDQFGWEWNVVGWQGYLAINNWEIHGNCPLVIKYAWLQNSPLGFMIFLLISLHILIGDGPQSGHVWWPESNVTVIWMKPWSISTWLRNTKWRGVCSRDLEVLGNASQDFLTSVQVLTQNPRQLLCTARAQYSS